MTHSPEPWTWRRDRGDDLICDRDGESVIVMCAISPIELISPDYDRIVACVNALAGLPTGVIEQLKNPQFINDTSRSRATLTFKAPMMKIKPGFKLTMFDPASPKENPDDT